MTIRELYAKHRTVQSCNDCHKKIDPLGFALENFDAIGKWREKYESGHRVDSSGRMPNGDIFKDVVGLKEIMVNDLELFARNLSTKLLTYATGRTMEVSDRPLLTASSRSIQPENGLKDLLTQVVLSEDF